jgi:hypothetical protein
MIVDCRFLLGASSDQISNQQSPITNESPITNHQSQMFYSCRNAMSGSIREARRAGIYAAVKVMASNAGTTMR